MHSLHLLEVAVLRLLEIRVHWLLEILIRRLLVVLVLRLRGVVVGHAVCDWRCLTVLLVVENRLTDLHIRNRILVNNRSQGFETGVLNITYIVLVNRDLLMVYREITLRRGVMIVDYIVMLSNNSGRSRFLFGEAATAGNTKKDNGDQYDENY